MGPVGVGALRMPAGGLVRLSVQRRRSRRSSGAGQQVVDLLRGPRERFSAVAVKHNQQYLQYFSAVLVQQVEHFDN